MIKLNHLSLQAFRSFVDKQELDLPGSGLHLISAPSGSGKSSLVESIAYALGYSNFSASDSQSWLTETPMQVSLDFDLNGVESTISRGSKVKLKTGSTTLTSASTIKSELPQILGLDPELISALTYRPQRQLGLFVSKKDSEKKAFLTQLLDLQDLEEEIDSTQKKISALEKTKEGLAVRYDQAKLSIPEDPPSPKMMDVDPFKDEVARLQAAIGDINAQIEATTKAKAQIQAQIAVEVKEIEARYDVNLATLRTKAAQVKVEAFSPDPEASQKMAKLQERLTVINAGINKFKSDHAQSVAMTQRAIADSRKALWQLETQKKELPRLTKEQSALEQQIRSLEAQTCPTCSQTWLSGATTLENLKNSLAVITERISSIEALDIDTPQKEIANLEVGLNGLLAEDPVPEKFAKGLVALQQAIGSLEAENKGALSQFNAEKASRLATAEAEVRGMMSEKQTEVSAKNDPALWSDEETHIQQLRTEQYDLQNKLGEAKIAYESAKRSNLLNNDAYTKAVAYRKGLLEVASAIGGQLAEVEGVLRQEEDFYGLIKSFLALVFDETLQQISAKANDLIETVPNMAGITVAFTSDRELKNGNLKNEIRLALTKDGHEVLNFRSGLSGGQQAVVELVVDLALSEVVSQRTGTFLAWLILDEPFDGLDEESKKSVMDVLAKMADNRAIFVIDHNSVVKEMFSSVIKIECENGRSTLG